ncbi:MAG: hypothetical protein Q7T30_02110, partial [Planctomycetota bacterium]|nr:hypothetical protein [Planctomycetota bacterium]
LDGGAPIHVANVKGGDCNSELVVSPSWGEVRITQRGETADPENDRLIPKVSLEGRSVATTSDSGWVVDMGNWASEGLFATHRPTGRHLWLALDTPFLAWASRDATLLPGDVVVYALGPHIVALELATLRLAVLAQGHSPVVALDAR